MTSHDKFLIAVIDLDLDVNCLVKDCLGIIEDFKKINAGKTDLTKPYSILLTKNEGFNETKNELVSYSDVHNTKYFDRVREAQLLAKYENTSLDDLANSLPFAFSIMRLSVLPANTIIGMHTDNASHAQIAIVTNKDCFVAARSGETAHIAVDGKLYVISTTLPHTAFNASSEERVHLSISIYNEDYVNLLKA